MRVVIPSKGRPDKVRSQKLITTAVVYVPASEVKDYRAAGVYNLVAVPNRVRGITKTRNWILDHTTDPWVVMIDDDLKTAGWRELKDEHTELHVLTEDQWLREWARLFGLTIELKFRIWGVATISAPRAIYPWSPLIFQTYVTASCMGILNDGRTRFDESYPVKEDYELCLRCIVEDGGILGARYLFWENEHWSKAGGCATYRTQAVEDEMIRKLIATYPGLIRKVTRGGSRYSVDLEFPR